MNFRCIGSSCLSPLLLLALMSVAIAGTCPGPNKTPHRDGNYDFTYESRG